MSLPCISIALFKREESEHEQVLKLDNISHHHHYQHHHHHHHHHHSHHTIVSAINIGCMVDHSYLFEFLGRQLAFDNRDDDDDDDDNDDDNDDNNDDDNDDDSDDDDNNDDE